MGQRFNNLDDVYNTLVGANFNFDQLPSNNKYRKYKEWKINPELRKLGDGVMPNTGDRTAYGIRPFGVLFDDANKTRIKISGRVHSAIATLGGVALFNLTATPDASFEGLPGYVPAKAILAAKTASTSNTSKITGRKYKSRSGESYTVPFGKSAATDNEFDLQDDIIAIKGSTHVITFTPERLRRAL
jgi:hypothetical protein